MTFSRRSFLTKSTASATGLLAMPGLSNLFAASGQPAPATPRFIFIRKSNGMQPEWLVPPTLSAAEKSREDAKQSLELDLSKHELPDWMQPLAGHQKNLTILQGLSAKMCTMGHSTYQSPLGVCRSAERVATITRATVDVELGRMFTSPFEHIELTCSMNQTGVVRGMSAIGPMQPNYAFASPGAAYRNLFQIAAEDKNIQIDQSLNNNLYAFISQGAKVKGDNLGVIEGQQKIGNYVESADALIKRNKQLKSMADEIRRHTPKISTAILNDQYNTIEQQQTFVDVLVSALRAGLSNVFTLTLDDLGTVYSGLFDFDVHLHEIGHNKEQKGVAALDIRTKLRTHHMTLVNKLVDDLKNTPTASGSAFDHTVIMYLPENGEKHHSVGTEVPFVILAGDKVKLRNIGNRYIRLPEYTSNDHKTLGNFYTTILNAYGNPIKHYGDFDVALKINQAGPIKQLMS